MCVAEWPRGWLWKQSRGFGSDSGWCWSSYLLSLSLRFCLCEEGIKILLPLREFYEIKLQSITEPGSENSANMSNIKTDDRGDFLSSCGGPGPG